MSKQRKKNSRKQTDDLRPEHRSTTREYQPFIVTDEASLLDAVATEPAEIKRRLTAYFRVDLEVDIDLPIWRVVDEIKRLRPGWPEDFGPN